MSAVPYEFQNVPGGSNIPLAQLDSDFVYVCSLIDALIAAGPSAWGSITGDIANQSDLQTALALKMNASAASVFGLSVMGTADAGALRTLLSLVVGTNVQAFNANLTALAALAITNDSIIQAKAGAWAVRTIAQYLTDLQGTGLRSTDAGFRGIPPTTKSSNYTVVLADSGTMIEHPASDTNARTFTIDSVGNQNWDAGATISFKNETSQILSIAVTTQTLTLAGTTTSGTRSLAQNGVATAHLNATKTTWLISGAGLT